MSRIVDCSIEERENGCDFIVSLDESRKNTKIKLLQITDMQFIDAEQRRYPDRLCEKEIEIWQPENLDKLCGDHIRRLVSLTSPDLIFLTGDLVYGSFDDNGTVFEYFCDLMDSFEIPWAPVFGNHDNESKRGVRWQCEQFEKSKYCLFKRGEVSGNGNYSVGIAVGEELVRVLHMADTNGCSDCEHQDVIKESGIYPDQIELIKKKTELVEKASGKKIPAFIAFHIPTNEFKEAERAKGYINETREVYTIGKDVVACDGDFGAKHTDFRTTKVETPLLGFLKECNIEAVFCGHWHRINTVIGYEGIKWVFGMKTGKYDSHTSDEIGGTLVSLDGAGFEIKHIHVF